MKSNQGGRKRYEGRNYCVQKYTCLVRVECVCVCASAHVCKIDMEGNSDSKA